MPLYNMVCANCTNKAEVIAKRDEVIICDCGSEMERQLPTTVSTTTYETKDPRTGKQLKKNLDQQLKKRSSEHHDRYEIAEKIDKHGMDDAQKFGWIKKYKRT